MVAAISVAYVALLGVRRDRNGAIGSAVVAAAAAFAAWHWRTVSYEAPNLPIYAYGVMLGLSLVVGWYVTLPLAEKDGLPKETMANCYVVTALAALAGSRILYTVTNPDEFKSVWDLFALRNGGLVAYGGFIGGLVGSWAYLAPKKIRLLAWADDAVPSLASGLLITRIGCYLFGCDFGKRLADGAPRWLQALGTFPHWAPGTLVGGEGSPAFVRHLDIYRGTPLEQQLVERNASFPVHPTQLYESLVGLLLFCLLLWQRKYTRFRGQVFFVFVFAYGFLRFVLELWRDDVERGSYGPTLDEHVYVPLCMLVMALAFVFGISLGIVNENARIRMAARVAVVRAGRRGVRVSPARDVRADGALPALDESAHRPPQRRDGGVLLCALLGGGAKEPEARDVGGRPRVDPRAEGGGGARGRATRTTRTRGRRPPPPAGQGRRENLVTALVTHRVVRTLRTRSDTRRFGVSLARVLSAGDLAIISGDLGAGKTFLVRSVARALGVEGRVTSPTFTLVHEYPTPHGVFVHADLYRLLGAAQLEVEIDRLGLRAMRAEGAVVAVEWGQEGILPLGGSPALVVSLAIDGEHQRTAMVSRSRAEELARG